jgi:hypothetical protein
MILSGDARGGPLGRGEREETADMAGRRGAIKGRRGRRTPPRAAGPCDAFRCRLAGEDGHYRFVSARFAGAKGESSTVLRRAAAMLLGKRLDEVDVAALVAMAGGDDHERGCLLEAARKVADMQHVLLSGGGPQVAGGGLAASAGPRDANGGA